MSKLQLPLRLWIVLAAPLSAFACIPRPAVAPSARTVAPRPTPAPVTSTDINKLAQIITLPRRPVSAVWRYSPVGAAGLGPTDYRLAAVIQFSPTNFQDVVARPLMRASKPEVEAPVEPWYPAALRKKAHRGAGGKLWLRCLKLEAGNFFKGSLQNGNLLQPIGTHYLILSLFTT